jgi:hypothetical protein
LNAKKFTTTVSIAVACHNTLSLGRKLMRENEQHQQIDFNVNKNGLYREVTFTDLRAASIRKLVPILVDGTDDKSRSVIFIGTTQLMTPDGPLPIQTKLSATSLDQALDEFPGAMRQALAEVVEEIKKMQQEQERQSRDDSRIIVPGR